MGERLVVEIKRNHKALASVYYHWSAYTQPALEILKSMYDVVLYKHHSMTDNELQLELIRFAEHSTALGYFENPEDSKKAFFGMFGISYESSERISEELLLLYDLIYTGNGGVSGHDRAFIEAKFPGEKFASNNINRNSGLVSLSEENIESTLNIAQGIVSIDLNDNEILFGIFNEIDYQEYLMETEDVDDEDFIEIENIPICPVNPLEFKLEDIYFMRDFCKNSKLTMFRYGEKIYTFISD